MEKLMILLYFVALGNADDNLNTTLGPTTTIVSNFSVLTTVPSTTLPEDNNNFTTIAPSTTIPPKNESRDIPPNKSTISNRTDVLNTGTYNCACDLTLNICDLNCCCDIDCTPESLETFDCSKIENSLVEYYHGYGLQHCEVEEGFFCIVKDNLGDPATNVSKYINF